MACLLCLPFCRWAWQNTDHCRHANHEAPADSQQETENGPTLGQRTTKSSRRNVSLKVVMYRLHLLLRSNYFRNWPLELRFFQPDVHQKWKQESSRADGLLSDTVNVILDVNSDLHSTRSGGQSAIDGRGTIERLDLSNKWLESYREKAVFLLDDGEQFDCSVCKGSLQLEDDLVLVCPQQSCKCVSHLKCLAATFLEEERVNDKVIPSEGPCPACHSTLEWPMLIRELSRRTRGQEPKWENKSSGAVEGQGTVSNPWNDNWDRLTDALVWHDAEYKRHRSCTLQETNETRDLDHSWLSVIPESHNTSLEEDKESTDIAYNKHIPRRKANNSSDWDDVMIVE